MNKRHNGKHHSLVTGHKIVEEFLGFYTLLLQLIGDRGCKVVVVVLTLLPACYIGLNAQNTLLNFLNGFISRDRQNIYGQHEIARHIG